MLNSSGVLNTFKYSLIGSIIFNVIQFNSNKMNNNDIVLILLTAIELVNLVIRVIKLMPQHDPPKDQQVPRIEDSFDKNILKTMYC